jgi:predicted nucleotidyltransferase/DNA-binding CsgD family transcriptional regulator
MSGTYDLNHTTLRILGLYRDNYRKSLHQREIARALQVSTNTSYRQLRRLERARVMTITQQGRNTVCALNLGNLMTKYYMILAETFATLTYLGEHFLIKRIMSELDSRIEHPIILFGGFAKGLIAEESDIDLFVLADRGPDDRVIADIGELIGREISIKSAPKMQFTEGLASAAPLMREVVASHIVLKGIDEFCDVMWRYYARP